ncbi:hypothetical protein [Staphylococcus saprophyticus]|uniref:hypothetical protein n=1 Tax=Staphylococcus saprophyticus TaxID=29385 RepID=UPI0028CB978A|nr:hypothetical protein [Staphylococcus saprophyticus]
MVMYGIMGYLEGGRCIGLLCIMMIFGLLGLLGFKLKGGKVFMGERGSLGLGGMFGRICIMLKEEV